VERIEARELVLLEDKFLEPFQLLCDSCRGSMKRR
jgi:hypothetical protein